MISISSVNFRRLFTSCRLVSRRIERRETRKLRSGRRKSPRRCSLCASLPTPLASAATHKNSVRGLHSTSALPARPMLKNKKILPRWGKIFLLCKKNWWRRGESNSRPQAIRIKATTCLVDVLRAMRKRPSTNFLSSLPQHF